MPQKIYKLVVIGDGGVGKTSWVKRLQGHPFQPRYIPTLGVEVHPIQYDPRTTFNIWDCAGQAKLGGLRDGYYIQADCALVMFDWSHPLTLRNVDQWIRDFKRVCPGKPIVVVGNKEKLCTITKNNATLLDLANQYALVSVKRTQDLRLPLNALMQML